MDIIEQNRINWQKYTINQKLFVERGSKHKEDFI